MVYDFKIRSCILQFLLSMGKSKANKHSKQVRDNPTGVVNNRVDSDEVVIALGTMSPYSQTALSSETLKSLSKQLQSSSIEDRDCVNNFINMLHLRTEHAEFTIFIFQACHALAGLIRNDADSCAALHEGLIKSITWIYLLFIYLKEIIIFIQYLVLSCWM